MLKRLHRALSQRSIRNAEAAHENLRLPEEARYWEAVLRRSPQHARALRRAAELAPLVEAPEQAEGLWERALSVPSLRARAHGELARRAFERDDLTASQQHVAEFLERTEEETRAFSLRRYVESLSAHMDSQPDTQGIRHLCVTGVAFSGSTLFGHLLGRLPGIANIGESHWLIHRRVGRNGLDIDFSADKDASLFFCNTCGPDCSIWTWELRRSLSEDRRDWFQRIARHLETRILVSTDKNQLKHLTQDPWLRFDSLILFRHPRNAWHSAVRPGRKWRDLTAYMRRWDEHYRKLVFDLPNRGRKACVDLDRFRDDAEGQLAVLTRHLGLPDGSREKPLQEHTLGGNGAVVRATQEHATFAVAPQHSVELTREETSFIEKYVSRSEVYAALREGHNAIFENTHRTDGG